MIKRNHHKKIFSDATQTLEERNRCITNMKTVCENSKMLEGNGYEQER